ncbi:hypothetical protein [Anaerotardibacter muris]|uniref:hypothetical protein n=1 Tax=Anaerotardibacter muris TaxID=2941505 RepID=UPI00203FAA2A|nr:hypothetical protein [Anaerotardibacter muris]
MVALIRLPLGWSSLASGKPPRVFVLLDYRRPAATLRAHSSIAIQSAFDPQIAQAAILNRSHNPQPTTHTAQPTTHNP